MSLLVWLPMTQDLHNQGLSNMTFSSDAGSNITLDNNGKIGKCYSRVSKQTSGKIISNSTINLSGDITMACWALVSDCVGDTANGLISNHSSGSMTGVGITVKQVSASDYRISCSTGTGSSRTYMSYYGTTNIKDSWHHLALTYSKSAKQLILYVDGKVEYTLNNYTNGSAADYIKIFDWSTSSNSTSYRPAVKLNDVRIYDHCLSIRELKTISSALMLHYPLNDAYVEETSNLFRANINWHTSWNNTGSATWNWNDNSIPKINNSVIYSISRTDTGNSAIGCGACDLVAGKTYTASVYVYLSGDVDSTVFYIRSASTSVATLKYNNDSNPQHWPQNQWIRVTATFTTTTAYSACYVCGYLVNANSKRALTCWQIEEKDHATPYTPNIRHESTVYDCSGYQNNGTIVTSVSCTADSPRYKISTHFTSSNLSSIDLPSDMSCLSGNNEQTLSCWVKSSGLGSGMEGSGLISLGFGNTLYLTSSSYCYRIDNGSNITGVEAKVNPHDGKWHLVTGTYKSGVVSIYVDGVLKNTASRTFSNRYINTGRNCIGVETNSPQSHYMNGDISDIRMYATALSADDIKELYSVGAVVTK